MKTAICMPAVFVLACLFSSPPTVADTFCRYCPPVVVSPTPNQWFSKNQAITYCWGLADSVPADSVAGFEIQFANSPPYAADVYDPDPSGGVCDWDPPRFNTSTCLTVSAGHQCDHEPIYWRVRTVYINGERSNWAVSYHRVGDHPMIDHAPLTITYPGNLAFARNHSIAHGWQADPSAEYYEIAFANAPPNTTDLFDDCEYDVVRTSYAPDYVASGGHQGSHYPVYFLVRAVYQGGARGNWAISYYYVDDEDCVPVPAEKSTWGKIKTLFE